MSPRAILAESMDNAASASPRLHNVFLVSGVLVAGIGLAVYAYIGAFTRYWADDFCIADSVQENGLFGAQALWWENWTGRYSSVFASDFVVLLGKDIVPYYAGAVLAIALFLLSWTLVQFSRLWLGRPCVLGCVFVAELILVTYVGAAANRIESVYWIAGSTNYTLPFLPLTLLAGFIAWSMNAPRTSSSWAVRAVAFVVAFAGAGFSETYMVWQSCLLLLASAGAQMVSSREDRGVLVPVLLAALSGSLVGGAIVYIAPGNEIRETQLGPPLPWSEVVLESSGKAAEILRSFLLTPEVLMLGLVAMLLALVARLLFPDRTGYRVSDMSLGVTLVCVIAVTYLLVVATVAPAFRLLGMAPFDRGWVVAEATVIAAVLFLGFRIGLLLGESLGTSAAVISRKGLLVAATTALVLVAGGITIPGVIAQFDGRERLASYAEAWDERDAEIRAAQRRGERDIEVSALRPPARLLDITSNRSTWSNICIASYYELDSIRSRR